jgi:lysophospholipase L1-like esterase
MSKYGYKTILVVAVFVLGFFVARSRYRHAHQDAHRSVPAQSISQAFYDAENASLPVDLNRRVVIGDSLVELWAFSCPHTVNRGFRGDTTELLLRRFEKDAISLKPRTVLILAGLNDLIARVPVETIETNLLTMYELASRHHIKPTIASVLPVSDPELNGRVQDLNSRLQRHAGYMNLFDALAGEHGTLDSRFTWDGIHLNGHAYQQLNRLLCPSKP